MDRWELFKQFLIDTRDGLKESNCEEFRKDASTYTTIINKMKEIEKTS